MDDSIKLTTLLENLAKDLVKLESDEDLEQETFQHILEVYTSVYLAIQNVKMGKEE